MATWLREMTVVARLRHQGAKHVTFETEDDGGRQRIVAITADDWREMGSPEVVTLTARPGDTLNG